MTRKELLERVCSEQIIGVVREDSAAAARAVADAYARNGIMIVEITLTSPDAFDLISYMAQKYAGDDVIVAAGTVRSSNDAASARRAGAKAIVSPHADVRVIEYAVENDLLAIAGAATPTEIIRAWEAGSDIVKVYPAQFFGGPDYIRTGRRPRAAGHDRFLSRRRLRRRESRSFSSGARSRPHATVGRDRPPCRAGDLDRAIAKGRPDRHLCPLTHGQSSLRPRSHQFIPVKFQNVVDDASVIPARHRNESRRCGKDAAGRRLDGEARQGR